MLNYSLWEFQLCLSLSDLEDGTMDEFEMFAQWVKQGKTAKALANVLCFNPASKVTSTCVDEERAPIEMGARYYRDGLFKKYEIDKNGNRVTQP